MNCCRLLGYLYTGSGAGGSIRLDGADIEVGSPTGIPVGHARVDGGTNNTDGSDGYIAAYYQNSLVINAVDHALNVTTNVTATPEPTVVAVPTIDPASAVWHSRTYNYSNEHPNRITDTTDGDAYKSDAPRARGAGVSTQKRVSNANGNQVTRLVDGVTQTLVYNAENRLASVTANGAGESYLYDGDGVRVARVRAGEATYLFMGGMYEVSVEIPSGTVTDSKSYYTAAGQVIAVRDADGLEVMLTDHLESVVGVVDSTGALVGEQRYLPFGQVRTDLMSITSTDLSFTGQRALEGTGLLDYHARQYDPALRSFIQPDSIIPNLFSVLDYNRFLYVHANPVRFTDPSGNKICDDLDPNSVCRTWTADYSLAVFGLSVFGTQDDGKWEIVDAVILIAEKISPTSPESSFNTAFGKLDLRVTGIESANWSGNCLSNSSHTGEILCKLLPDTQNFIHEVGHVFDKRYGVLTGDTHLPNDYIDKDWILGYSGYKCSTYPCLEHPASDDGYGQRGRIEDFADMFLNWMLDQNPVFALNGFTSDEMGTNRRHFMDNAGNYSGMTFWLNKMGIR